MYPIPSAMLHSADDDAAVLLSSRVSALSAVPTTTTNTTTNTIPGSIASVTKFAFSGLNMDLSLDCTHSNTPTSGPSSSSSSSSFPAVASPYFAFPLPTLGGIPAGAFASQQQQQRDQAPVELFFQFDYGDSKSGEDVTKAFMQDFMNMPMDSKTVSTFGPAFTSNALAAPLPPFDPFVLPEVLAPEARRSPRETALSFDRGLDSPLGFDSPDSEAAGGLFDEDDLDELPPLDFDSFVQEPVQAPVVPSPSSATSQQPSIETPFDLSFPCSVAGPYSAPSSSSSLTPTSSNETAAPTPSTTSSTSTTEAPQPKSRTRRTKATGFRGVHTKLTALDAPIQQRNYAVPSVTARKRKTMAVERELAKRLIVEIEPLKKEVEAVELPTVSEGDASLPEDLVEAVEKKRLQNTLSARKSRQRKQERLAELEERNVELEAENKRLEDKVQELERRLAMAGLF
ncbi:BQ2448_1640 [Microbotryum intermedium]|uniref:BQ2448_1640 protein n=1 Tax=Microbotryum intermedium TaxID=269621 RepID=A0A238FGS0_9BASI|nr:BQ2448_1640 [Microbotryum intermedium]